MPERGTEPPTITEDELLWNDPQMRFAILGVVMSAQLWHVEPDDRVKVSILHQAVSLFNDSWKRRTDG